MKNKFRKTLKYTIASIVTIFMSVAVIDKDSNHHLSLNVINAKADPPTNPPTSGSGKVIETLTGAKLMITDIDYDFELNGALFLGQIILVYLSPEIMATITAQLVDVYQVRCLEGGSMDCSAVAWTQCPPTGCPTPKQEGEIAP